MQGHLGPRSNERLLRFLTTLLDAEGIILRLAVLAASLILIKAILF